MTDKEQNDIQQAELLRQLRSDIANLVMSYADKKLHPELLAAAFSIAGMKVITAMSATLIKIGEEKENPSNN